MLLSRQRLTSKIGSRGRRIANSIAAAARRRWKPDSKNVSKLFHRDRLAAPMAFALRKAALVRVPPLANFRRVGPIEAVVRVERNAGIAGVVARHGFHVFVRRS